MGIGPVSVVAQNCHHRRPLTAAKVCEVGTNRQVHYLERFADQVRDVELSYRTPRPEGRVRPGTPPANMTMDLYFGLLPLAYAVVTSSHMHSLGTHTRIFAALGQAYVPVIYYFVVAMKVFSMLHAVRQRPRSLTYIGGVKTIPSKIHVRENPVNGKPRCYACLNSAL
jgi:hypothetical protein